MKNQKKGFTLVELVIVIAVIAILAGVLIGTFATVISRANQSKAMQEARTEWEEFLVDLDYTNNDEVALATKSFVIKKGDFYFAVKKGQFDAKAYTTEAAAAEAAKPGTETLTPSGEPAEVILLEIAPTADTTNKTYYFVKLTVTQDTMPANFYVFTEVPVAAPAP